jgi:hypothetical protein
MWQGACMQHGQNSLALPLLSSGSSAAFRTIAVKPSMQRLQDLFLSCCCCCCCRLAFWGGFAFFMLAVAYISFKRTPAFMKQSLYSLLLLLLQASLLGRLCFLHACGGLHLIHACS